MPENCDYCHKKVDPLTKGIAWTAKSNNIYWLHEKCNSEIGEKIGIFDMDIKKKLIDGEFVQLAEEEIKRGKD